MRVVDKASEAAQWVSSYRAAGLSVGLVPTLGGLHAGHFALVQTARRECEKVVVSLYLNPTQFNSPSDLETYPGELEADLAGCREHGVDLLFLGQRNDLLPACFQSWVEVERLSRPLCGEFRPGHFRGVATVVTQLLHILKPHRAYFGYKDYQQALIVRRAVADLFFDVEIRGVETVRDFDGVALSSRNALLTAEQRSAAAAIPAALVAARRALVEGERDVEVLRKILVAGIELESALCAQYASILSAVDLEPFPSGRVDLAPGEGVLLAVAALAGSTRLIDNVRVWAWELEAAGRPQVLERGD